MKELYKQGKRVVIGVIGFTVLLIGVAMIVLPGPSLIVLLLGLGILATEFIWARRLLEKVRGTIKTKWEKWRWGQNQAKRKKGTLRGWSLKEERRSRRKSTGNSRKK